MIAKGTAHNNGAKLAHYMITAKEGERAELWDLRGFEADNIKDAFRDVQIMAEGTRATQPFFHVQVRNPDGEELSREQWERVADRIESKVGLSGQPRAIAFHIDEKTGHEHMHLAWSRIDEDTLKARPLPFFKLRLKEVSRELEIKLDLTRVNNEVAGPIKYAPTRAEEEQARRLGMDIHEVRQTIRDCYERSDSGRSFEGALAHEGLILAKGDRRDFMVIDREGGMHALGKRILDVSASEIRARLADLVRDELPSVEQARDQIRELRSDREKPAPDPIWDRDRYDAAWQDAVARAAIEKEKIEGRFTEPKPEKAAPANGREKEATQQERTPPAVPELGRTAGEIRLAYSLSDSAEGFVKNLEERGYKLAHVTQHEADRSHRRAAFAREVGRRAPEYEPGQYVVINERGHVYSLNRTTTGESRGEVQKFLATLDAMKVRGIDSVKRQIDVAQRADRDQRRAQEKISNERPLTETQASIRLAYNGSNGPESFIRNLDECGLKLACVTKDEADRSHRVAALAKETGRFAREYQEGEYVAINERGHVHKVNERSTGDSREEIAAFMRTLDPAKVQGMEAALQHVAAYKRAAPARELWKDSQLRELDQFSGGLQSRSATPWQQFGRAAGESILRGYAPENVQGPSAEIWNAYIRSDNAPAFAAALKERNISLAVVTANDVSRNRIEHQYQTELAKFSPRDVHEGRFVAITDEGRVYNLTATPPAKAPRRFRNSWRPLTRNNLRTSRRRLRSSTNATSNATSNGRLSATLAPSEHWSVRKIFARTLDLSAGVQPRGIPATLLL